MTTGVYKMSKKELSRLEIIQQTMNKQISQIQAALLLNIGTRQVRRLQKAYREEGAVGLISHRRGAPSNNRLDEQVKAKVLALIKLHYHDFGPTLAHEKLTEKHGMSLSVESVRKLMIRAGLWEGKKRREARIHQQRPRRSARGELVQIDGSHHAWFEDRGEACCLLVFVDDATSALLSLHFVSQECTQGYFDATEKHIKQHGIPVEYYSDKHGIFRVNVKEANTGDGLTQFGRTLKELGIAISCASSPQAKGRVERANGILQDRLIKEMRLRGISDINTANDFLPEFITSYNKRFAKEARSEVDAHRNLTLSAAELKLIFSQKHQRVISKNLEVSYNNKVYQIQSKTAGYTLRKARVTVYDHLGEITLKYKQRILPYKVFDKQNKPTKIVDSKQIQQPKKAKKLYKPAANHPWKSQPNSREYHTVT